MPWFLAILTPSDRDCFLGSVIGRASGDQTSPDTSVLGIKRGLHDGREGLVLPSECAVWTRVRRPC